MSPDQLTSVAKGAAVAAAGAALAYLSGWVAGGSLGEWGPVVGAVLAVLVNVVRKWAEVEVSTNGN